MKAKSHERYMISSADLAIIGVGLLVYFIPTFVGRNKRNANAICALNVFLGWTILGWVAALVWAMTSEPPLPPVAQLAAPILCANCGKYSVPGSEFCGSCGGRFA